MRERHAKGLMLRFAIAALIASATIPVGVSVAANPGPQRSPRTQSRVNRPRLVELANIDHLKEVFERDAGKVRLVVLVSPT